jgi:hypothetical protein
MQAESLEVLEKADVAPAQARAIVRAIEIEIAGAADTLATKQDVGLLRGDLHRAITEFRAELSQVRTEFQAKLETGLASLRADLSAKIDAAVGGVVRQLYLAILGQMAVLLGFSYFFATHVR